MGRALFSHSVKQPVVVRAELPPVPPQNDPYGTWSIWNNFDPDSEEFFDDAEYEAFLDPEQVFEDSTRNSSTPSPLPVLEDTDSSSSSSEGGESDHGSPMAVGSDDPATMIANAYTTPWAPSPEELQLSELERRRYVSDTMTRILEDAYSPRGVSPPPLESREGSSSPEADMDAEYPLPTTPQRTTTVPIDIPVDTQTPTTRDAASFTPGLTPSPAPAVTPRIYNWNRIPAAPSSPTSMSRTGSSPSARMSLGRITPVRVRIQGFTV